MSRAIGGHIVYLFAFAILTNPCLRAAESLAEESAGPAIELGAPFADDAILQQGMKAPVWGWSKPGTAVTVEFRAYA